ncbi:energy-coupling factor transport system substrate-specific component [Cryobacterium sp. MP_M5]|uniref:ECF transporter S component n=1 Tax=unclassified Cryobacterium TaxID=2649013 RepID=UPI0018CA80F6|nr:MULTISPECIES: ECF transporter S component [unclassified Cryobacterium]MBG6057644.1 energy-coupling factor transport system substrate-specific component [Cryobacterium sp. MP_M3]MEC5175841.1 energy-coupling factor transport system substrate-specific component [Cryobacterium sp. MP_M5]
MHTETTIATRPVSRKWRVVDIVIASVIGVASGLIFVVWNQAYNPLSGLLTPLLPGLQALLGGGWLFAGVLGGLIIRKPGAALYTELLAAVVSTLVGGTAWGATILVSGVVQGLGAELVFAIFLYANYRLYVALLSGAGAGLALAVNDLLFSYPGSAAPFITIYTLSSVVSGIVVAGLLSWLAMRGLARTGALSRFAAGRAVRAAN